MRKIQPLQIAAALAVATSLIMVTAPAASANTFVQTHAASRDVTVTLGASYGGVTSQEFPVVIDVNRRRTRVVRAVIAIRTSCTAGGTITTPDGYIRMVIRRGRFSASFGPSTQRNPDGTTTDFEGTISGTVNSSRTKVSGTWSFKGTDRDASGAVTDTCDSGRVSWSARQ